MNKNPNVPANELSEAPENAVLVGYVAPDLNINEYKGDLIAVEIPAGGWYLYKPTIKR